METNIITKDQLEKLVSRVDGEFETYFKSNKAKMDSLRDCFFIPKIYEEEKLFSLNQDEFRKLPKDIQEKAHELIAEFTKVD